MAKNDIRFFKPPPGRNPGIANYGLGAGQTFEDGEVVVIDATTGLILECADDPALVTGISAVSSQGRQTAGTIGVKDTFSDIAVYTTVPGQLFISSNFATDGAGTAATPTFLNIGDTAGFTLASGEWFVDTGTANLHVEIVDILNTEKHSVAAPLSRLAGTGYYVVFGFI